MNNQLHYFMMRHRLNIRDMYKAIDEALSKIHHTCFPKDVIAKLSEYDNHELYAMLADLDRIKEQFSGIYLTLEDINRIHRNESVYFPHDEFDEDDDSEDEYDDEYDDDCDECDNYDECLKSDEKGGSDEEPDAGFEEDRFEANANASLLKALHQLGVYEIGVGFEGENGFIKLRSDRPISVEVIAPHKNAPQTKE